MMKEDFLHYIWKYKKIALTHLKTREDEVLILKNVGTHNTSQSGPDFFNARVYIGSQQWAGNVEIHVKASDWYVHHHEADSNYDNVILHVVWEDDVPIFRKDNTPLPTLQLKDYVSKNIITRYQELCNYKSDNWIPCSKRIGATSSFLISQWKERLYIERLQEKTILIKKLLIQSANDWESVLFKMMCKTFGLKVNGSAFLSLAQSIDFKTVKKEQHDLTSLESLLFGQSGLLKDNKLSDAYTKRLTKQYDFLKHKYRLSDVSVMPFQFFRLRPANFPTIRIAQLAALYHKHQSLLSKIMDCITIEDYKKVFSIEVSDFWKNHYTLTNESSYRNKPLSTSFIELLLINTIIPIKFMYTKEVLKQDTEHILELIRGVPAEKNNVVLRFHNVGVPSENAMESQSLLQLKTQYCDQKKCLQCMIGNYLLNHR